jgi:hypothetical protein
MKSVTERGTVIGRLSAAWKRQLVLYLPGIFPNPDIYAVYKDETLTGWAGVIVKPSIGTVESTKCLLVPVATWMSLRSLSDQMVLPFRIVAKGNNLIAKAWKPNTGLKYTVRNTAEGPMLHIPVQDFEAISD